MLPIPLLNYLCTYASKLRIAGEVYMRSCWPHIDENEAEDENVEKWNEAEMVEEGGLLATKGKVQIRGIKMLLACSKFVEDGLWSWANEWSQCMRLPGTSFHFSEYPQGKAALESKNGGGSENASL